MQFPLPVEISDDWLRAFNELISEVCKHYEATHPSRVMWLFGQGQTYKYNWHVVDENHPQEYNELSYTIEVSEREKYSITEAPSITHLRERAASLSLQKRIGAEDIIELIDEAYAIGLIRNQAVRELRDERTALNNENDPGGRAEGAVITVAALVQKLGGKTEITVEEAAQVIGSELHVNRLHNRGTQIILEVRKKDT